MAKTCPTCHSRQSDELEFCPLDGAHLQTDPTDGPPPPPAGRSRRPPPGAGPAMAASSEMPKASSTHRPTLLHAGGILAASAPTPAAEPCLSASTFATALARGPMSADQAVARLELIAKLVAESRSELHGALTPWHVLFGLPDGKGRPTLADTDVPLDPLQYALYEAPELQQPHSQATAASEVYALGCMLFEAIAGRVPFPGQTSSEVRKRHASAAVPAVRMVRRDCDLPPSLEVEIQRALKKRPGDRHATALAFAEAISAANREDDRATMAFDMKNPAVQREIAARLAAADVARISAPLPKGIAPEPASAAPVSPVLPQPVSQKSSKVMLIVALIAIVVLGVVLAMLLHRDSERAAPPPVPARVPATPDVAPPAPDVAPAAPDTADTADAADAEDIAEIQEEVAEDAAVVEPSKPKGHGHAVAPKGRDAAPVEKPDDLKKGSHPEVF